MTLQQQKSRRRTLDARQLNSTLGWRSLVLEYENAVEGNIHIRERLSKFGPLKTPALYINFLVLHPNHNRENGEAAGLCDSKRMENTRAEKNSTAQIFSLWAVTLQPEYGHCPALPGSHGNQRRSPLARRFSNGIH